MNNNNEQAFAEFAESIESNIQNNIEMPVENDAQDALNTNNLDEKNSNIIGSEEKNQALREAAKRKIEENAKLSAVEEHENYEHSVRQAAINNGTALAPINIQDLPSKGMFYPTTTKIWIKSATLGDIKRWTSMDEGDVVDIQEKMQNIIESCCVISFGSDSIVRANWKDILDIDRLYLLFAIHDYTFPKGTNDIRVKLNEKDDVVLVKESVKFIEINEKLMKFYNADERCFQFPVKNTKAFAKTNGKMNIYMTNLGVANWILDYVKECERRQDTYDKDFVAYAALLIKDWRGLTNEKYYDLIDETRDWGIYEWTLISKVKDLLTNTSMTPVMRYIDNGGTERETPLYFRDGLKGLFQQSLDIDL